ncbi:putative aminoadipate reductase [Mycena pura]|uniref:Aminoadipate reductase n=1 Tax=Mycena pura TaxID=153505 RepID=A0AAD6Y0A8_9AGAR|nr:putative aminoadipate reductase [Mycena pura]
MSTVLPPLDCSLNVSQIIDVHLEHANRSAAYSFADADGHITEISHLEFARAAHRVAHLLRPQRRGPEGQVVAIVALTDVLIYQTLVAGCIKAGLVPFEISHRNSDAALFHLLSSTGAHRVLTTRGSLARIVDALSSGSSTKNPTRGLSIEEIPLLGQLYPRSGHETVDDTFVPYPSPASVAALDSIAMYLHSSGSTGFPKPIPETHRTLVHYAALDVSNETVKLAPRHAVGHLPPFHAMGMLTQLIYPIFNGGTACIYPPVSTDTEYKIPISSTPENALENAQRARASGITAVPAFLMQWQSTEHVEYLKTLNVVAYSGGPLATAVGDFLVSQGVNLVSLYGATEFGIVNTLVRRGSEWAWFKFSSRVNVRWVPQGDGTFECQFLTTPTHQVAVENLPDVKGYSTKDVLEQHPTKPDLYRIVGRLDDVLIMANGEKTVPGPIEDVITASPYIAGAVMFGRERNQVGILVEPTPQYKIDPTDAQQVAAFRNLIWDVTEEANKNAPAFARIYKEMIQVTQPSRPMIRTPKGTVVKKATIALYKEDIEALYSTIEASANAAGDVDPPASWTAEDLEPWLMAHATLLSDKNMRSGGDLFDQGFDSLNSTFLRHRIVGALKSVADEKYKAAARNIPPNFVYAHPSIEELARAVSALVRGDANSSDDARGAAVEAMIARYSEGFDDPVVQNRMTAHSSGAVVLLTGSTGGLGSHILEILLSDPSVERVYAFNRSGKTTIAQRQQDAFADRALDVNLLSSKKLVYLVGDSSKEHLGLSLDVWNTLRDTTTVMIHNAWTLNFNKTLSSFEPHVRGTRNLIDLARQSPNAAQVRFLFTSSIATALGWDPKRGPFPEELQLEADVAVGNGYGESKYVSERILAASGLQATSFRIGQVVGSGSNGAWSTSDWVPAIVKSSIALGNFPSDSNGTVAWLTPEAVSHAIVDVALRTEKSPFAINLVHPRPIPWDAVISSMAGAVRLPLVPIGDWISQIETRATHATTEDMENIPGIKLLDFFRAGMGGSVQFSTSKAQAVSESMHSMKQLSEDDVRQWIHYWRRVRFIK